MMGVHAHIYQLALSRPRPYKVLVMACLFATRHFYYPEDPITIHAFTRIITAAEHESLKGKREYDYVLMLRENRLSD